MAGNVLFNQILSDIYTETNRPDLVNETTQALFEAKITVHLSDYYRKDIVTAQTTWATSDYIQTIDTSQIPNYRALAFLRKSVPGPTLYQPTAGSTSDPLPPDPFDGIPYSSFYKFAYLTEVEPDDIVDDYFNVEKLDIFYQSGDVINIKSSTSITNAQFGWYVFPNLDIANGGAAYTSWIAQQFPYAIIYKAAATVFKKIGQDAAVQAYNDPNTGLYAEQLAMLKLSNIKATGF